MIETQVAIIGGGLAGLRAAQLLHEAGVAFTLLEARARLGGRILTVSETGEAVEDGFDLGPSWFWPRMQPDLGALVAALGLAAFAQNAEGDVLFERMSREGVQRYRGDGVDQHSMRLAGGTASLVRALAERLPADRVHLGAPVTAMTLTAAGIDLNLGAGEAPRIVRARAVIAALPPRLLEARIGFTPALPADTRQRWRACATWMAPHAKYLALYDEPFWRRAGLSGTAQSMVGPLAEIHDASTATGRAALFGFVGLPAAQRAAMGEAALAQACLAQLARLFGPEAAAAKATLFKDWAADPLTATAADHEAGGHPVPSAAPWLSGPWAERLWLAGSETSRSEPGYLAGAVDAAESAARAVLARLR
ncbi:flavin monoamine oxidase family protein [Acidocella facilis]|uniref:flavin monoamine oxidase family protein n=1 Tax=Acidocella facilis TaxID=525 RepID=UPI001F3B1067|nr:FAD-dependent oxidoreductase [Acidocella facilis]